MLYLKKIVKRFCQFEAGEAVLRAYYYKREVKRLGAALELYEKKNANLIERLKYTKKEFASVERHEFGSFSPGISAWKEKWDNSPGKRVLLYAYKDYSGSFFKWARAINEYTDFAARLVTFGRHQYGYDIDLLFPNPKYVSSDIEGLIAECDIIHIKDETGFLNGSNMLPRDLFKKYDKPMVFTQYGGYARKHKDDKKYQKHVLSFDAQISMTPDLNYEWLDFGYFIPHSIDTEEYEYCWRDSGIICHSPSTAARKGTDEFKKAIDSVVRDYPITFDLISGVSHRECIERKSRSAIFFDQAGREIKDKLGISDVIGWYGNSALEAAVCGIPTMAHMSEHAFDGARRAGKDIKSLCAIINIPLDSEGMEEKLREILSWDSYKRKEVSIATRRWVEDFHSDRVVGSELAAVYERLL